MLSKAELEVLTEKYEAKAERAYQNYQETGISRYDRERRNAAAGSDFQLKAVGVKVAGLIKFNHFP